MTEIDFESIGASVPLLDPRDEEALYQESRFTAFSESGGTLNDFTEGEPTAVLLRGLVFAGSEIQYRNQQILPAIALKVLEAFGGRRILGAKAIVEIRFRLTTPLGFPFVVPKDFELTSTKGLKFYTVAQLEIPAGQIEGFAIAQAEKNGTEYNNVPAFAVNSATTPLTFLASVTNQEPPSGGENEQAIEDAIAQSVLEIRTTNLASQASYEDAAIAALGLNAKAVAIPFLSADKQSINLGTIHIFILNQLGLPATNAEILKVDSALRPKTHLGSTLIVSPMDVYPIEGTLTARLREGIDPQIAGDRAWQNWQNFFLNLQAGESLLPSRLAFFMQLNGDLQYIEELLMNDSAIPLPMPNKYTVASVYNLALAIVTPAGGIIRFAYGEQEPLNYAPI